MIITIDGPTASGKSTVARLLADKLSYYYLSSGLLFRALAYVLVAHAEGDQKKLSSLDAATIACALATITYCYDNKIGGHVLFDNKDITAFLKGPKIDYWSSVIATQESVRHAIAQIQRSIGKKYNLVVDGRDCGTTVFPDAEHKFYLTASIEVRADRWQKDQEKKGNCFSLQESIVFIEERDRRDTQRELSPLKPAEDARIIDNSCLTITQSVDLLFNLII